MDASVSTNDRNFLFAHRVLMRSALSLVATFAWIFVFQYYLSYSLSLPLALFATVVVYGLSQALLVFLTPFSAAHLRGGVKRSMMFGASFAALALAILGATIVGFFSDPAGWGIVLFGILFGAYRALYWIPYRIRTAPFSGRSHIFFDFLIALMPLFAGITIASENGGFLRLLSGAAACIALSIVPLLPMTDVREKFSWSFDETFQIFFNPRHRLLMWRTLLAGFENAALFLIWPLAVFLIVGASFPTMGLVLSASLVIVLLFRGLYRRILKRIFERESILLTVVFVSSGWLFRFVAGSPFAIVFADTYSFVHSPFGARELILHESSLDGGSYLDEFTALQEIGQGLGRILMCAFVVLLLPVLGVQITLALSILAAGIAAGGSVVLAYKIRKLAY